MSATLKKYPRCYALLKKVGHSPFKAGQIVLDARRKDKHAREWIIAVFAWRKNAG